MFLISIEGIHGAGKSTFINVVSREIEKTDDKVYITKWNSNSLLIKDYDFLKERGFFENKYIYLLFQAADLMFRYNDCINRRKTKIVLFDRYCETLLTRGIVRGIEKQYIQRIIKNFKTPDISIYIDISVNNSLTRTVPSSDYTWQIGMGKAENKNSLSIIKYKNYLDKLKKIYSHIYAKDINAFTINGNLPTQSMVQDFLKIYYMKKH